MHLYLYAIMQSMYICIRECIYGKRTIETTSGSNDSLWSCILSIADLHLRIAGASASLRSWIPIYILSMNTLILFGPPSCITITYSAKVSSHWKVTEDSINCEDFSHSNVERSTSLAYICCCTAHTCDRINATLNFAIFDLTIAANYTLFRAMAFPVI